MRRCALALGVLTGILTSGCSSSARLVSWGQDGGVVAIPSNSSRNLHNAQKLMAEKCPQGYVVDRQEEVVVGKRKHTKSETKGTPPPTLVLGGESESKGRKDSLLRTGLSVALPVGEGTETTRQTTTYRDVTEYRIWFRPANAAR